MRQKAANFIVKHRKLILCIYIVIFIASIFTVGKARINYDFTVYLGENTVTRRSLDIMNREFGTTEQITVLFTDMDDGVVEQIADKLNDMDGIMRSVYAPESDLKIQDGTKYERLSLYIDADDPVDFVGELNITLQSFPEVKEYSLSGSAPQTLKVEQKIADEVPIAMAIAVVVVIGVLFLTSHSWIEPAIFGIVLIMSILINMGTNFIFSSISFITFAVCAILQLALAMDYSIMLLHSFCELRDSGMDDEKAITEALVRSFMPISSSSITTVAGLVSLMFMSFTIGFDIGIVLSKGILISMITVFTLMPALIILFAKPLKNTAHKVLPLGGSVIGNFAWLGRKVTPFILIAVILVSCVLQGRVEYTFTDSSSNIESDTVSRVFGMSNQMVLLLPAKQSDEDFDRQRELIARLKEIQCSGHTAVTDVTGMVTTGEAAIKYYTVEEISELLGINRLAVSLYFGSMGFETSVRGDVLIDKAAEIMPENEQIMELKETSDFAKRMFISDSYARLILLMDVPNTGEESFRVIDEIQKLLDEFYPDDETGMAGNLMSSYDISSAFTGDMLKVNLITVAAIFLIILISFKSFIVPLMLICVIQGAVFMNISISSVIHQPIFFMCYLICLAIQMGATIDYGILLTSHYIDCRRTLCRREALIEAIRLSMPTIFTSGLILTVAGFAIGYVCSVYYIYSIGRLLARGTLMSLLCVLVLLPPLLLLLDKPVIKKHGYPTADSNIE